MEWGYRSQNKPIGCGTSGAYAPGPEKEEPNRKRKPLARP